MKKIIGFFISLCIIGCTTSKMEEKEVVLDQKQKPETEKIDSLSFFLDHYEKFFATNFNISECPGAAIVIVKDSTVIYKRGFGVKEIHTTDSVDVNTVFRIASLSKGVTSVLAGNLVDNNELQWGQSVNKSVKSFDLKDKAQAKRLKVNHLLSHTAGLYKYTNSKLIHKGLPLTSIISNFKRNGVVAKEGTDYEYQNAVFSVVEKVMENATEKSFEALLKERLFIPAGMENASSTFADIKQNTNVALPHKWNHYSKKYSLTNLHRNYYNVAAAGGINASISDMAEYLKVLLGYRPDIISKESLTEVFNPMICTSQKDTYVNLWDGVTDSYYAKGWRVLDYRDRTIIYHGGNVNQYKTQLMIDPENKIGVCVLFNGPNPFNGPVIPTFLNYYDFFADVSKR
ncbi:class A beta-lactamase-related serine hydrolase [Aquimarina sp. BL5]|uniref:serine hydrolase domain-containing protein n=1 Tax=Aquimarina sp. BL5 TaxID=1714860 RepID=UPI000E474580|nr:serine hydrolase domain-containing protein [Aquimarina sp. BL5]AXT51450.1 class A beta-lactamase-related serine hydrolase [Aquimarina sp. BL5]RKN10730.1 class A beta-lactamase-related serine hydrolase [Aquimarina sp. BL5]